MTPPYSILILGKIRYYRDERSVGDSVPIVRVRSYNISQPRFRSHLQYRCLPRSCSASPFHPPEPLLQAPQMDTYGLVWVEIRGCP